MKILLLVVFVLINYLSFAQENININYINPEIHDLIKVAKIKNLETQISVYSLQLEANETLEKITKIKKKYNAIFPSEKIDELFEAPYFKLITGNYLDKKQAEKKLKKIKRKFKAAFILEREISIEEFKKNK